MDGERLTHGQPHGDIARRLGEALERSPVFFDGSVLALSECKKWERLVGVDGDPNLCNGAGRSLVFLCNNAHLFSRRISLKSTAIETINIQGQILTPTSGQAYADALHHNSDLSSLPAKYVVQPISYSDIPPAILSATSQSPPLEIAIKGGGTHSSTWASPDGGVVIDLSKLSRVTVAADKHSVTVQGGARWGDVYEVCEKEGVDVVGGPFWFVGVGGFTLGGGYGSLSGEQGLAIDNLLDAIVVLADGHIVKANRDQEPDLFWAIRGGGSQYGIVVKMTFKAYPPVRSFTVGAIAYPGKEIVGVLKILQEWKATQTSRERLTMSFSRAAPHFNPSVVILPWVAGDHNGTRSKTVLAPFREGPVKHVFENLVTVPGMLAVSHSADAGLSKAPRRLTIRGTVFSDFFPELLLGMWEKWVAFTESNEDVRSTTVLWDLTYSSKIAEVDRTETALNTREPHNWMAIQGRSTMDASVEAVKAFNLSTVSYIREKNAALSGKDLGWFLSVCQGDEKAEDVFGENLPRLRKIKAKYDPKQVWSKGFVIVPDFDV